MTGCENVCCGYYQNKTVARCRKHGYAAVDPIIFDNGFCFNTWNPSPFLVVERLLRHTTTWFLSWFGCPVCSQCHKQLKKSHWHSMHIGFVCCKLLGPFFQENQPQTHSHHRCGLSNLDGRRFVAHAMVTAKAVWVLRRVSVHTHCMGGERMCLCV